MIELDPKLLDELHQPGGLHLALQRAIELEHATLPAYLYAYYSLGTDNPQVAKIVFSVIFEEMLHFALACNILNAIGGSPDIDRPDFIPRYPGPLPGSVDKGLTVHLRPMSRTHIENTFMVIEEPEHPLNFPELTAAPEKRLTIGMYYTEIEDELKRAGPAIFERAKPGFQVTGVFPSSELFRVNNFQSAVRAITLIKEQGEGTSRSPIDLQHDLAHYYRFAEIFHGHTLQAVLDPPPGTPPDQLYRYDGPAIVFDETRVLPLTADPSQSMYPPSSQAYQLNLNYNYAYTSMLKALHLTFNGKPNRLDSAIALMHSLHELAMEMSSVQLADGRRAGPSFQYQPVNP
jgi:ferritin-like protein